MEEEVIRVRTPQRGELLGEVQSMSGASRFIVKCKDGKERTCRIPGKFRKRIKISVGDLVLVIPWTIEGDSKADIEWIYSRTQANWLKKRGFWQ